MSNASEKPKGEKDALTPKMRDLIARFDAKDRRDESKVRNGGSKQKRRREDKSRAA